VGLRSSEEADSAAKKVAEIDRKLAAIGDELQNESTHRRSAR
jgi:hypothetical protein